MAAGAIGTEPYAFEWVEAPQEIAPYLNSLYVLRAGSALVEDTMPAYSGQMVLTLRGGGKMRFASGKIARSSEAFFQCPLTEAHRFELEPHTVMLGVSLNFRGWAALTQLPVDTHRDSYMTVREVLGDAVGDRVDDLLARIHSGAVDEKGALDELGRIVADEVSPLSERHQQVIDRTLEWLSSSFKPDVATLYDKLPYSERQVQRLVTRFFGQPPVRLIRRYRAIRAATLLAMPDLSPTLEAEIREAFYDQAHMIKEIRQFTGRTPRRLRPKEQSVVKETLGEAGYGSVDLFGGNQDEMLGRKSD